MVSRKRDNVVCGCSLSCWCPWKSIWLPVCLLQQWKKCPELLSLPCSHSPCCSFLAHMLNAGHSPLAPVSLWGGGYCWWTFRCPSIPIWGPEGWIGGECDVIHLCLDLPVQWWLPHIDEGPLHLSVDSLFPLSIGTSPSEGAPIQVGFLLLVLSNLPSVLGHFCPLSAKGNGSYPLHIPALHVVYSVASMLNLLDFAPTIEDQDVTLKNKQNTINEKTNKMLPSPHNLLQPKAKALKTTRECKATNVNLCPLCLRQWAWASR